MTNHRAQSSRSPQRKNLFNSPITNHVMPSILDTHALSMAASLRADSPVREASLLRESERTNHRAQSSRSPQRKNLFNSPITNHVMPSILDTHALSMAASLRAQRPVREASLFHESETT